jgi:hypothetical protein
MSTDDRSPIRDALRRPAVLGAAIAGALAIAAHYEVLGYWFTGPDTLTLIETSRIQGSRSAIETLTKPLMHGTNFVALTGLFYRPVASLSYAIDYALWGLNPVGYHLTDLLAHSLVAALVARLVTEQLGVRSLDSGQVSDSARFSGLSVPVVTGVLAGAMMAIHPLTAEVVPVPARRHDVLATLFVLASLWALARGLRSGGTTPRPKGIRYRYFGAALLAYALALGSKEVGAILPVLAVTWSALSTHGQDGRVGETIHTTVIVGLGYAIVSLCYLGARVSLLGGLGGYVGPFGGLKNTPVATLVSQYLLSLFYPVDAFGMGTTGYDMTVIRVCLAVGICLAVLGVVRAGGLNPALRSRPGRIGLFYAVWLCLPVPLLVRVGEYSPWTGYIAIVPVAVLCALLCVVGARDLTRCLREATGRDVLSVRTGVRIGTGMIALLVAVVLVVSLVSTSALVHPYDGWDRAGDLTREALVGAEQRTEDLPANALIRVAGLPTVTTDRSPTATARTKSLRYFWAHSVRSWLRLRDPASRVSTFTYGQTRPVPDGSVTVRTRIRTWPNEPAILGFRYERANRTADRRTASWHADTRCPIPPVPDARDRSLRTPDAAQPLGHPPS